MIVSGPFDDGGVLIGTSRSGCTNGVLAFEAEPPYWGARIWHLILLQRGPCEW